jgi:hypothetical protein
LGYRPYTTEAFPIALGEVLEVELRISTAAVPLEPVVVSGRRIDRSNAGEFRRRAERGRRAGQGEFITRAQLDSRIAPSLSSYIARLPQVRLAEAGGKMRPVFDGSCLPDIYINAQPIDVAGSRVLPIHLQPSLDELFSTSAVEGLEIYRPREVPPEYARPDVCGVIVVWMRMPEETRSRSRLRLVIGSGLMLGLLVVTLF